MSRRVFFERLAVAGARRWPEATARLLLLTGQSRLARSPLSEAQSVFVRHVAPEGVEAVGRGFPWDGEGGAEPPPGLLSASPVNARQHLWAVTERRYAALSAAALQRVADSTRERLVVLTGSNGLATLQAAWPALRIPGGLRLVVVAVGPAGAPADFGPDTAVLVVRGRADGWSRALYRGPVHQRPPCGHLGYWNDGETREGVRNWLRAVA